MRDGEGMSAVKEYTLVVDRYDWARKWNPGLLTHQIY